MLLWMVAVIVMVGATAAVAYNVGYRASKIDQEQQINKLRALVEIERDSRTEKDNG